MHSGRLKANAARGAVAIGCPVEAAGKTTGSPRADGYIRTELHRDVGDPTRYVTIDYWDSEELFNVFRETFATEFEAIDERCEALTVEETRIGSFSSLK